MKKLEKQLLAHFRSLQATDADSLLAFAEFLASRVQLEPAAPLTLNKIPRPAEETVMLAIKRLSATYPMLDKDKMLHEISGLMAQHLMQGRAAGEVIDELEEIFQQHYAELQQHTD